MYVYHDGNDYRTGHGMGQTHTKGTQYMEMEKTKHTTTAE